MGDKELAANFKKQVQETSVGALDHDTLKVLLSLFRQRGKSRRGSSSSIRRSSMTFRSVSRSIGRMSRMRRSSVGSRDSRASGSGSGSRRGSSMSGLKISVKKPTKPAVKVNPFADVDAKDPVAKAKRDQARSMRPLHMRRDCPEGFVVDAEVWGRMNELRTQKIESEQAVKKQSALVEDITGYSSALKSLC